MASQTRVVARDCRWFLGDRPCVWHKREGSICECNHYEKVTQRVLLIKLDAMGDVLRTTCLLPVIDRLWNGPELTWITRPEAVPLLRHNPHVREVVPYGADALVCLETRCFDRVINLDVGRLAAGMATLARAPEKIGYVLDPQGLVAATNPAAESWLRMGVFDDLKRQNTQSYQAIMCEILGAPTGGAEYVLHLTEEERRAARARLARIGVATDRPAVGVHTGGGTRWRLKQWREEGFVELLASLRAELGERVALLLFGGPAEREQNARIAAAVPGIHDTGCDNDVRQLAALVGQCSVLLSGDSLAMHLALATGCRAVVLFGPTSHAEIELFGRGEKVIPELDCLVCYKTDCDFVPNCMETITVPMVKDAVVRQLEAVGALR